jgi:predicted nucleic-acid-binding protein
MKITADTNILVRAMTEDDAAQSKAAQDMLLAAELVALPVTSLCELVWVLTRGYRISRKDIAATLRRLVQGERIAVDLPAVAAGLATLDAGGDFADGVIAHQGRWLGAQTFVSFDQQAVALLKAKGESAVCLV